MFDVFHWVGLLAILAAIPIVAADDPGSSTDPLPTNPLPSVVLAAASAFVASSVSAQRNRRAEKIPCPKCSKQITRGNMSTHLKKHDPANKSRFQCDKCDKTFSQKQQMQKHISAVHEKQKPFKCDQCDKTFSQKENMETHRDQVHRQLKKFECDKCDRSFLRECLEFLSPVIIRSPSSVSN